MFDSVDTVALPYLYEIFRALSHENWRRLDNWRDLALVL